MLIRSATYPALQANLAGHLIEFVDGEAETDEPDLILALRQLPARYGLVFDDGEAPAEPSKKWTKAQLTEWAQAHKIDLGEAATKDEILAAIEKARTGTEEATTTATDTPQAAQEQADPFAGA